NIFKKYFILSIPFLIIESLYPKIYKRVLSISEESRKKFNINAKVISNGINKELFQENIKKGKYIGYIGRIDIYNKGLDLLINAVSKVDIQLLIAGKGKDERKLRKIINTKGLKDKVKLVGFIPEREKLDFIKNTVFLLMPSRFEGQGIVALEAAALGKPLIVSDIPELKYVTENGFGISFRSEDVESLREAIEFLLKNESLIEEMGLRGRRYAAQFTWDKIADEYEKYLYEVFEEERILK
ncbi:MAG: glycosyltransferase family 4 protein, partial [Thermodesulfovibrionaceae bacterium]